jgi:monoterpene epsilon-lactone hydrolase
MAACSAPCRRASRPGDPRPAQCRDGGDSLAGQQLRPARPRSRRGPPGDGRGRTLWAPGNRDQRRERLAGRATGAVDPPRRAYQAFCSNLALRLQATVVVPDYRLAPENPFPAAVEDAIAAFRSLLDAGHSASTLALMGDSAGGGLVLSCLIAANREGFPQPAAAVGLSAWADLTLAADSHRRCAETDPFIRTAMLHRAAQHYLAGWDAKDPLASPAHATSDELRGLAPVLLQTAANEVLADDSTMVAERIAAAGGDVTLEVCPQAFHVWQMAGSGLPEADDALSNLTRFVRQRWSDPR